MSALPDHPDPADIAVPTLPSADIDFAAALGEALAAVEKHAHRANEGTAEATEPTERAEPSGLAEPADATALRRELDEARRETARLKAELARAHDDLAALRRLAQRQEADLPQQAARRLVVELLPALDHLDTLCQYMLAKADLADADRQALEMLDTEWRRAQQRLQLEPYDAVGKAFDGQHHEVIATLSDASQPPGVVLRQAGRGYLWGGKLLRMAQVVINAPRAAAPRS